MGLNIDVFGGFTQLDLYGGWKGVLSNMITTQQGIKVPKAVFRAPGDHNPFVGAGRFEGNEVFKSTSAQCDGSVPTGNVEEIGQVLGAFLIDCDSDIGGFGRPGTIKNQGAFDASAIWRADVEAMVEIAAGQKHC